MSRFRRRFPVIGALLRDLGASGRGRRSLSLLLAVALLLTGEATSAQDVARANDQGDAGKLAAEANTEQPRVIPDRVVVLTFDDSVKSHFTVVRPILRKYGFGATFFITEGFDFKTNKDDYMTWKQIEQLHRDGFEIGNHTRDHLGITDERVDRLAEQLEGINARCREHGIPQPISFAWPGNALSMNALPLLKEKGIQLARRGGGPEYPYEAGRGFAYQPGLDHPLLIPSAGDARPNWEFADFRRAVEQAKHGRIAVLQFHGVPDKAHPWVHTPKDKFEQYMRYLAMNDFQVIALRDLLKLPGVTVPPRDPQMVIKDRKGQVETEQILSDARPVSDSAERKRWLQSMLVQHDYAWEEAAAALGASTEQVKAWAEQLGIDTQQPPHRRTESGALVVEPFPGGRHPRIGFLDGAIRPQRETKVSVFAPWKDGGYAVVDVPEAIWMKTGERSRRLLYLAHTHVPTIWDDQQVRLEPLEWKPAGQDRWRVERRLPNGVSFGAETHARPEGVAMRLWLENGSEQALSGLAVQNCVMLKSLNGFEARQNENRNKRFQPPYAACHDANGKRWVITAWTGCQRAWGNVHCPCLHADPQFPDCPPGERRELIGWISFYEGQDLDAELKRLESLGWDQAFESNGKN